MTTFDIRSLTDADIPALEDLSALAFGPGRFVRTAYRVREGVPPVPQLRLTAWRGGSLVGGLGFTAIRIGATRGGLLLGPLVVHPEVTGNGCGQALVNDGLKRARDEGFGFVILVGDVPYYAKFGFEPVSPGKIVLPGPVDPARLLAAELKAGSLDGVRGCVTAHAP